MTSLLSILGTYLPLLYPLPGAWNYWYLLLLPLCLGVSIVYKAIRCASIKDVPREAAITTVWILLAIFSAAGALVVLIKLAGR